VTTIVEDLVATPASGSHVQRILSAASVLSTMNERQTVYASWGGSQMIFQDVVRELKANRFQVDINESGIGSKKKGKWKQKMK